MASTRLPPGPRGVPWFGTLPALYRSVLDWAFDIGRGYGDLSFTRLGPAGALYSLNRPDLIEEVLVGKYRDCIKDNQTRQLSALIGDGLLTSEGEPWRKHRKLAAPTLQPRRIAQYADVMLECIDRTLGAFADGEVRPMDRDMASMTLEIAGRTLLGFDTRGQTERVAHILDVSMAYFSREFHSWHALLPRRVSTPARRAFRSAVAELDRMLYDVIAQCRREGQSADHLLARLIHARDDDGGALSDQQIRDEAVTLLLAGHETTALMLCYAAYALAIHPEVAKKLQREVDRVLGTRRPTLDDLARMPYLDAVLHETLRIYPPAYLMGREVIKPFELAGYAIPVGAALLMSPWVMHRDPRFYPQPERFDPERWLTPTAQRPKFAYFPFGGGPRICIGNHFAMLEAALAVSMLAQRFELEALPGFVLKFAPSVTLRPGPGGVPLRVRKRAALVELAGCSAGQADSHSAERTPVESVCPQQGSH